VHLRNGPGQAATDEQVLGYERAHRAAVSPVPILLVEDHVVLRDGLRALLEVNPEFEVVGEAGLAEDALALASKLRPAIVLADIALPDRSGIALVRELAALDLGCRVIMLTAYKTEEYIRAALEAGAGGYILKDASFAELVQGVLAVASGRRFLCRATSDLLVGHYISPHDQHPVPSLERLTRRETDVLGRIASGESNKQMARSLSLSVKTVEKHRSNLMRKLMLHNTAEVTLFAIRNGLVNRV
jgi:DNA-binding NarL/FixJ family response regulator